MEVRGDGFLVFALFADLLAAAIAFVDFAATTRSFLQRKAGVVFEDFRRVFVRSFVAHLRVYSRIINVNSKIRDGFVKKKSPFL